MDDDQDLGPRRGTRARAGVPQAQWTSWLIRWENNRLFIVDEVEMLNSA
jgi:hypothetical protein